MGLNSLLFVCLHAFEDIGLDNLSLRHGREPEPHGGANQGDALAGRFLPQRLKGVLRFLPEFFFNGAKPVLVLLVFEEGRDTLAHINNEPIHRHSQTEPATGGKAHGVRFVRTIEVIHVDPVRRRFFVGGPFAQVRQKGALATGPLRTHDEDVKTRRFNAGAEGNSFYGTLLTEGDLAFDQVVRRLEREDLFFDRNAKLVG